MDLEFCLGRQLKSSQEFLLKEIQRFKQDFVHHSTRINQANELRQIDQNTLKSFQTKFQDLSQLLAEMKKKEMNTWNLVQILRVNTSRLWHIFESATGSTLTQEVAYEDLQNLLHRETLENEAQRSTMNSLEKQHADLLLKSQEIQLSLEQFRTTILHLTQSITQIKHRVQSQHQSNTRTYEETTTKLYQLAMQTKDLHTFLLHYKSLVIDIDQLLKLIFTNHTQIQIHQKSLLIHQMKLEKYKQDFTFAVLNRTTCENQIVDLRKLLEKQNANLQQFQFDQTRILYHRTQLHQQINRLEQDKLHLINTQQQLLEQIKQTTMKNHRLDKQVFQSNQQSTNLDYSYRKLMQNQIKQHEITHQLHRTCMSHFTFDISVTCCVSGEQQSSIGDHESGNQSIL